MEKRFHCLIYIQYKTKWTPDPIPSSSKSTSLSLIISFTYHLNILVIFIHIYSYPSHLHTYCIYLLSFSSSLITSLYLTHSHYLSPSLTVPPSHSLTIPPFLTYSTLTLSLSPITLYSEWDFGLNNKKMILETEEIYICSVYMYMYICCIYIHLFLWNYIAAINPFTTIRTLYSVQRIL